MSIWLFGFLIAFNLVSYIAQVRKLQGKRYKADISLVYLSFNIHSATEQANLAHLCAGYVAKKSRSPGDHFDLKSCDWMNLSRIATVWMIFAFVQFFTSVAFSSIPSKQKIALIVVYMLIGFDSLTRLISGNFRRTLIETFTNRFLLFYANPALLYLGLLAFSKRGSTKPDSASPLSLAGIASQVGVHGILATSWALMASPWFNKHLMTLTAIPWPALIQSWNFSLWPLVDNGIFAVLQGKLLWVAIRGRKVASKEGQHKLQAMDEDEDEDEDGETALPLTV